MSFVANTETENQEKLKGTRPQVSSAGKRLFALLIDFIFALLLANTLVQIFRREHWDLVMQSRDLSDLLTFYGSIVFVLIFKDVFGRSIGKLLLGMTIRKIDDFSQRPLFIELLKRNLLLLFFLRCFFAFHHGLPRDGVDFKRRWKQPPGRVGEG